jgi:hypothetical protein
MEALRADDRVRFSGLPRAEAGDSSPAESIERNAKKENNMNNLKKPIFWAWAVLLLYVLLLTTFVAIFIADPIWEKLLFVILDVSLVLVFVLRYPKMINEPRATTFPLITSITLILGGGFIIIYVLLQSQPLVYSEPVYFNFIPIVVAAMFPFGVVVLGFTLFDLISKKKSKRLAEDSSYENHAG